LDTGNWLLHKRNRGIVIETQSKIERPELYRQFVGIDRQRFIQVAEGLDGVHFQAMTGETPESVCSVSPARFLPHAEQRIAGSTRLW